MPDPSPDVEFERFKAAFEGAAERERLQLIERLVAEYLPYIRFLARPILGPRQRTHFDSEDICQSIGLRLAERLRDGRVQLLSRPQFQRLLRTMIRHLVFDKNERLPPPAVPLGGAGTDESGAAVDPSDSLPAPDEEIAASEALADLLQKVEKTLPPDEYYVFKRHYLEDVAFTELAKEFGQSPDAIRMRLKRAVERLRSRLEPELKNVESWFRL
jgi:RNA polymerase sigma factor (sigma-70 family)